MTDSKLAIIICVMSLRLREQSRLKSTGMNQWSRATWRIGLLR